MPADVAAQFIGAFCAGSHEQRNGLMAPIPAEMFNIAEANRPWVDRRCVPLALALATFDMPVLLPGEQAEVKQRLHILADGCDPSPFRHRAKQCEGAAGWRVTKLPCSHDFMVDRPRELAAELLKLA